MPCQKAAPLGLLLPALLAALVAAQPIPTMSPADARYRYQPPTVVPGSGYGCDLPCSGPDADREYSVVARVREYTIPGSADVNSGIEAVTEKLLWPDSQEPKRDASFKGRVLESGDPKYKGCFGMDGDNGVVGPCLDVSPGDTVYVKVKNEMGDSTAAINNAVYEGDPTPDNLLAYAAKGSKSVKIFGGPSGIQNLAGQDTGVDENGTSYGFNTFNLHFHGMEVEPHLFNPEATQDPDAEWVTIEPTDWRGQQCYCYKLHVSTTQAVGQYMYHIHRHGAASYQGWSGMVGLIQVARGDKSVQRFDQDIQLDNLGLFDANVMTYWDTIARVPRAQSANQSALMVLPAFTTAVRTGRTGNAGGTRVPMMNNGAGIVNDMGVFHNESVTAFGGDPAVQTNKYLNPYQFMRLNVICLNVNILCGWALSKVISQPDAGKPFTVSNLGPMLTQINFASDGISGTKTRNITQLALGPGQREDLLVSLEEPGEYIVYQPNIAQLSHGRPFHVYGTIVVAGPRYTGPLTQAYFANITLAASAKKSAAVMEETVSIRRTLTFNVGGDKSVVPYKQFTINSYSMDVDRVDQVQQNSSTWLEEWTLVNPLDMTHPIHLHVNPFYIVSVTSAKDDQLVQDLWVDTQVGRWRDTINLPPYGTVTFRQRVVSKVMGVFFTGKSVFHCHFMPHEDRGMMGTVILSDDRSELIENLDFNGYVRDTAAETTAVQTTLKPAPSTDTLSSTSVALIAVGSAFLVISLVVAMAVLKHRTTTLKLPTPETAVPMLPAPQDRVMTTKV